MDDASEQCTVHQSGQRILRSLLFVPGDSERKQLKAITAGSDALILDLEDSVAPSQLPDARARVAEFIRSRVGHALPELWVRVNALSSGLLLQDLAAILSSAAQPVGILLPKVAGAAEIGEVSHYLSALEVARDIPERHIRLLVLATETADALLSLASLPQDLRRIPAALGRIAGLTWGAEDLGSALGTRSRLNPQGELTFSFQMARSVCQASAAALNVQAIDTVYTTIRDSAGLERDLENARRDGFTGKLVIHPNQVAAVNSTFTPTEAEIEYAQRIVAAFEASRGAGVVNLDGHMIDRPHLVKARRLLCK
jgi:citrate lyase subunit beta/citryl-CoA lyase